MAVLAMQSALACSQSKVMLVAVEYGGQWPAGLRPRGDVDLVMVVQVEGEAPLLFAKRFLRKVSAIVAQGGDVVLGVMAVAATLGLRDLEARCAVARTILRTFRIGRKSALYLVEPNQANSDCKAHLVAIANGLTDNAATDCIIQVGFDTIHDGAATMARTSG